MGCKTICCAVLEEEAEESEEGGDMGGAVEFVLLPNSDEGVEEWTLPLLSEFFLLRLKRPEKEWTEPVELSRLPFFLLSCSVEDFVFSNDRRRADLGELAGFG